MLIHNVRTPRNIEVNFSQSLSINDNRITLLTGPNGSGKTDVLATIADVFHGALQSTAGAQVHWSRDGIAHVTESLNPDQDWRRGRVRVIAQTFSPFSRFPGIERKSSVRFSPIYARGHSSDEEYVCIGFNQHTSVDLRHLSKSIVENGILRLSEQPKIARVAFNVLEELDFKSGIDLTYIIDKKLLLLIKDEDSIEGILGKYHSTGHFVAGGEYIRTNKKDKLLNELDKISVNEIAEYIRGAIRFLESYRKKLSLPNNRELEVYAFTSFRDRHGMSSDFTILQSLAFLRRLELLTLSGCRLTSYSGSSVDLTQTSSGQQQMLCSIFGLASALEDDSIVLIDEPELSLHPRWQMNFLKHLETALNSVRNCHVIIATHSPLIAQAGISHGAEIINMGGSHGNDFKVLSDEKSGLSVEGLLVNVFDTPVPNSLHISNEIFSLVTKAESGGYKDKKESLIKLEEYLSIYQREGDGAEETNSLLKKAIRLVASSPNLG